MPVLTQLEEKIGLPLKSIWAMKSGLPPEMVRFYTDRLLRDVDRMPALGCKNAVILGSTNATAFIVDTAVKAGHQFFVLVGGKKIGNEHPAFTGYVRPRLDEEQLKLSEDQHMTEAEYAEKLLLLKYKIAPDKIIRFSDDTSTNTGANMRILKGNGYGKVNALELYTLAGSALRAFMTARKEFGSHQVMAAHNAYPAGVTANNWSGEGVGRAHIASEAAKTLGHSPLYVRMGYATEIDINQEAHRAGQFFRSRATRNANLIVPPVQL